MSLLREQIVRDGPLPFTDFMATALYQPTLGYYARETRQIGRAGDFFTSVSVGPLFGELLARRFLREWDESGAPSRWRILECGAHDGTLAGDILAALAQLNPQAFTALEYAISEPLAILQAAQRHALAAYSGTTRFIASPTELLAEPLPGVVFGNELLDALPFHVVEWRAGTWLECRVTTDSEDQFVWQNHPICEPSLLAALAPLGTDFTEGYRTEVRSDLQNFLEPLSRCLSSGLMLWPDYGFARPEYYHPARTKGTLRTFCQHRAAENPLARPGELDITAHVDFTAVAEVAISLGACPSTFASQGAWLTAQAHDWLLAQEGNPDFAALRQFQTLTHPAQLGGSVQVLELAWNRAGCELSTTDRHRLALRACPAVKTR